MFLLMKLMTPNKNGNHYVYQYYVFVNIKLSTIFQIFQTKKKLINKMDYKMYLKYNMTLYTLICDIAVNQFVKDNINMTLYKRHNSM